MVVLNNQVKGAFVVARQYSLRWFLVANFLILMLMLGNALAGGFSMGLPGIAFSAAAAVLYAMLFIERRPPSSALLFSAGCLAWQQRWPLFWPVPRSSPCMRIFVSMTFMGFISTALYGIS
jgi:hypothetical protein